MVFVIFQKLLVYENCFSFDTHDDSNHTFPNLRLVRESILNLQFSFFNYFNNFGQPLLGDGLTYPYSIQSLTYYFFDDHLAMTINRIIIVLLTLAVGYIFFLNYFKTNTSILLSILSIFNPVAFWYPVHHYQMTLFFYFSLLILIKKILSFKSKKLAILFVVTFILFINSVSILHVLLSLPFIFLFTFITNNKKFDANLFVIIGFIISSFVITANQNIEFFENISNSGRNNQFVYNSDLSNLREFFLSLIIPPKEWFPYNYGAQNLMITYYSFPILAGIFLGLCFSINRKSDFFLKALFCGLIPFLLIIFLNYLSFVRAHIPLIKAIDIKRLFYFCYPFTLFFLGLFLESCLNNKIKKKMLSLLSGILVLIIVFTFLYFEEIKNVSNYYLINIIIFIISITYYSFLNKYFNKKVFFLLFSTSIFLTLIPTISVITGINSVCKGGQTQYAAQSEESDFIPIEFLKYIKPYSRLIAEVHTHKGHGLRVANHKIFGGDARGIILDKNFGAILENKSLIKIDQVPYGYYFKRPWKINELNKLGIQYIITHRDNKIFNNELKLITTVNDYNLYKNINNPSIVSITSYNGEINYLKKIKTIGSQLIIDGIKDLKLEEIKEVNIGINFRNKFIIFNENREQIQSFKNEYNFISIPAKNLTTSEKIIIKYENSSSSKFFYLIGFLLLILLFKKFKFKNAR